MLYLRLYLMYGSIGGLALLSSVLGVLWLRQQGIHPCRALHTGFCRLPRNGNVSSGFYCMTGDNYLSDGESGASINEPSRTWRNQYGLNPFGLIGGEDPDNDGKTNFEEYCDGTDPLDAARLRLRFLPSSHGANKALDFAKGNSYRFKMCWRHNEHLKNNPKQPWFCWSAQVDGWPTEHTYTSYTANRSIGIAISKIGNGYFIDNEHGLLTALVCENTLEGAGNIVGGLDAMLYVYKCEVMICDPGDAWMELDASRVVLDNENLRVMVRIVPAIPNFALCRSILGDQIRISTSGTCPNGVLVPIAATDFTPHSTYSEIKISKTRAQLISLGLLPTQNDDGVDEQCAHDEGSPVDSEAFLNGQEQYRGLAIRTRSALDATPPVSMPSESYFKAAGAEIVRATFAGVESSPRQIMNQADVFYYSGHGDRDSGNLAGPNGGDFNLSPSMVADWWNRDLDCAVFSACSILDIGDYNKNQHVSDGSRSHGREWEQAGPHILLGYNGVAPGDAGGAPTRIINEWRSKRSIGDIEAWMSANESNKAWNACAIEKGVKYVYFEKILWGYHHLKKEVMKENWK